MIRLVERDAGQQRSDRFNGEDVGALLACADRCEAEGARCTTHRGIVKTRLDRSRTKRDRGRRTPPIAACTSQSASQSAWAASVERGKLLIPISRRDVRVAEGARLESVCRGNSTVGSNPTLSAIPIS